jgi:malonate transporter and related proteins
METIVTVILPVFGLIGMGFVARRLGYLDTSVSNGLSPFVFNVAVPVLIFRSLAEARTPEASPWPFWAAYFGGVAVAWAAAHLLAGRLLGGGWRKGVSAGITASFSNTVLLGVPLCR